MSNKSNGHLRSSLPSKTKPDLNKFQVSVDKLRYKVSKTMMSTDLPRNTKSKDENSQNKSKQKPRSQFKHPKQKPKSKPKKKQQKLRNKRSYDPNIVQNTDQTYNNTERRKSSTKKHHQTEVYEQYYEPQCQFTKLQLDLLKLQKPKEQLQEVSKYYEEILKVINNVEESRLHSLLITLHKVYTTSAQQIFELVEPYESLLLKRRDVVHQMEEQFVRNQRLFEELNQSKSSEEIEKLHSIIQTQRRQIQGLKGQKQHQLKKLETIMFDESNKELFRKKQLRANSFNKESRQHTEPPQQHFKSIQDMQSPKHEMPQLKDFKIDLSSLRDSKPIGYHEEFMSKLPEMSESWREQALRDKRY